MLLKCGVEEDSWESLGLQGDPNSPSSRKSVLNIHWKDWWWSGNSNPLATWCEEMTQLKRPRCWERLNAGGEGDDRGWDGWMASQTQWPWVWLNCSCWWGLRAAVHGVAKNWTQLSNWTDLNWWLSRWRIHLQCRRPGIDPWVGKIPWRRERLCIPVFCPGESHGLYSPRGLKESDTNERLSLTVTWCYTLTCKHLTVLLMWTQSDCLVPSYERPQWLRMENQKLR